MAWKEIPNEIVNDFRGRPMKHVRLDNDGEPVYKPFPCPAAECEADKFTNVAIWQEHIAAKHPDTAAPQQPIVAERDDSRASDIITQLLTALNNRGTRENPNPLQDVHKTNDGIHAPEVWRRAYLAVERAGPIKLKDAQYDWLTNVLDRKLPLSKADKEAGGDQQTVAMFLWSLSADNVQQALMILSARRVAEKDEDGESLSVAAGDQRPRNRTTRR